MLKVTAEGAGDLEAAVDADIKAFDAWFRENKGAEPLVRSEVAILKTYLWFKMKESPDATSSG